MYMAVHNRILVKEQVATCVRAFPIILKLFNSTGYWPTAELCSAKSTWCGTDELCTSCRDAAIMQAQFPAIYEAGLMLEEIRENSNVMKDGEPIDVMATEMYIIVIASE